MLFCNLFHPFQDLSRETECERFDLFSLLIHAIIIHSNGLHFKRLRFTLLPKPQTRNAPSIPRTEVRGFTTRFDKSAKEGLQSERIVEIITIDMKLPV